MVVTALFALVAGCARPQGQATATPSLEPSTTPVANHAPLTIADVAMHNGEVGMAYTPVTLSASGGVAPYHWTVSVGALPGGLALTTDGVVSGTPGSNGFFQFSVQVFDAGNDTAGLPRTIGIVPRLTAALVPACATECAVELGCVTVCGIFGQVSGGASPLTYKLMAGSLPSGTTLSGMRLNGTFTGLPGRLSFTVEVTDGFGVTATVTATYGLFPHISLSNGSCAASFYGNGCKTSIPYSGGTPGVSPNVKVIGSGGTYCYGYNYTCQTVNTPPPPGLIASASGGSILVSVPPATYPGFTYDGTVTLLVSDQNLCSSGTKCSTASTIKVVIQAG